MPGRKKNDWEVEDATSYRLENFYTAPGKDSRSIGVRFPAQLMRRAEEIVQAARYAKIRTFGDLARDALHHRLEYLKDGNAEDDSALRQMRVIEMLADQELSRVQFEQTLRKLSETVSLLGAQGHYEKSQELLAKVMDEVGGMSDLYWRSKLLESLRSRFGMGYEQ